MPIRSVLIDCGAWVVGSGALWFLEKITEPPRDFDILVPPRNWMQATRIINQKFLGLQLNSFGGLKITVARTVKTKTDDFKKATMIIDLWPQHLEDFFNTSLKFKKNWAVRIVPRTVICELPI